MYHSGSGRLQVGCSRHRHPRTSACLIVVAPLRVPQMFFFFATLCMTDRVLIQRNAMNFETVWVVYALPRTSSTHVHSSTVTH